jgi:ribosome-associated heat shock protein Hsp15
MESLRIDKWLWAARFYKTRSLAVAEIGKGRVLINQQPVKPAREVRPGDHVTVRHDTTVRIVLVRALSGQRGAAPVAQQLYEETAASRQAREKAAEQRRLAAEPALSIEQGRPTKRDRRQMEKAGWNDRWSASLES